MAKDNKWDELLKGAPSDWTKEDLIERQINYDKNILNLLKTGQMSFEDASRHLSYDDRSRMTNPIGPGESGDYPPDYENPVSVPTEDDLLDMLFQQGAVSEEKQYAHDNIDNLLVIDSLNSILKKFKK